MRQRKTTDKQDKQTVRQRDMQTYRKREIARKERQRVPEKRDTEKARGKGQERRKKVRKGSKVVRCTSKEVMKL